MKSNETRDGILLLIAAMGMLVVLAHVFAGAC